MTHFLPRESADSRAKTQVLRAETERQSELSDSPAQYLRYHLLLRLAGNTEDREAITAKIAKHPSVMWVNTFIGRFDIQVIVDARDSFELNKIRAELFDLANEKVMQYSVLTHLYDLEFTQLNPLIDTKQKVQLGADASKAEQLITRNFPFRCSFSRWNLLPSTTKSFRHLQMIPVPASRRWLSKLVLTDKR